MADRSIKPLFEGRVFTITTELVPPRAADADVVRRDAAALAAFADGINVPDGPRARVRMSALAAAALIVREGGAPILQMTCRDRNRIALAADAIGAAALGVEAVLPLYGDPAAQGDTGAADLRDVEPLGLIGLVADLNRGVLPGGAALDGAPLELAIGSAATAGPAPIEALLRKLDAGATFVQTQIVLDADGFEEWLGRVRAAGVLERAAVLPGITIPRSTSLLDQVARLGARVPDAVREAVAAGRGTAVADELVERLASLEGIAGVHLYPLGERPAAMAVMAERARAASGRT